jgi:TonB family protein
VRSNIGKETLVELRRSKADNGRRSRGLMLAALDSMGELQQLTLREQPTGVRVPGRARYRGWVMAFGVHLVVLAALLWARPHLVRVGMDMAHESIGAWIAPSPQPTATSGTAAPRKTARPAEPRTVTTAASRAVARDETDAADSQAGAAGAVDGATGPVRLSAGQQPQLLKKVQPLYPPLMRSAGTPGTVVLDAVIHRDGTIGDISVLQASNPSFAQSAIEAVRQWRYAPLGFEAVLTVTINFSMRGT